MRLLLVEDDVMVASGIKLGLSNAGYTVDWVGSAERAEQADELAELQRQRAEQHRQRAERLAEQLRSLGVEPGA